MDRSAKGRSNPWEVPPLRKPDVQRMKHQQRQDGPSKPQDAMRSCLALAQVLGCRSDEDAGGGTLARGGDECAASLSTAMVSAEIDLANKQTAAKIQEVDEEYGEFLREEVIQRKADRLAHAAVTLEQLSNNRDVVLAHMHEPCPGASIAVETAGQSDFLAILREAAQNRRALVEGAAHLQWANDFDKPCRVWSEMLRHLPEGVSACKEHRAALAGAREGMASLYSRCDGRM